MNFEFSTTNVGVADLEQVETGVAVENNTATASPPKRGRGRPKGSTKKSATAPAFGNQAAAPAPGANGNGSASANASANVQRASRASTMLGELIFDIETVPDYSRLELFGLDPLPEPTPETTRDKCPACVELLACSIPDLKARLAKLNPVNEYLDLLAQAESVGKNRDGVHKEIAAARLAKNAHVEAAEKRRKLLSVTPEYCRVAAIGWANRGGDPQAMVAADPADEVKLLEKFWELVKEHRPLVGFNLAAFDIPVILVRSAILGVPSSCRIDLKPWGGDLLDLMAVRFPPRATPIGLKDLCRLYGIHLDVEDVDGSQVEALLQESPEKVGEYCKSDVMATRRLHSFMSGYFF